MAPSLGCGTAHSEMTRGLVPILVHTKPFRIPLSDDTDLIFFNKIQICSVKIVIL